MKIIKIIFNIFANLLSIDFIFRLIISNKILVLLFHDVTKSPSEFSTNYNLNVDTETFEKQIRFISKYFNFIKPQELYQNNFDKPSCLITFDDGLQSYFTNALPIMHHFLLFF